MEAIINFLGKNGFCFKDGIYVGEKCDVIIHGSNLSPYLEVVFKKVSPKGRMYSGESGIMYWLIGVLTYYGLIDKDYKI
jgi:hypothetical protein